VKPKKKILVICPAPENVYPSQRLKYEQYFGHWRDNGYQIVVAPFMNHAFWKILYKDGHLVAKLFYTILDTSGDCTIFYVLRHTMLYMFTCG